jgi:hypothetical protein
LALPVISTEPIDLSQGSLTRTGDLAGPLWSKAEMLTVSISRPQYPRNRPELLHSSEQPGASVAEKIMIRGMAQAAL